MPRDPAPGLPSNQKLSRGRPHYARPQNRARRGTMRVASPRHVFPGHSHEQLRHD
jgi:hypothetical protein